MSENLQTLRSIPKLPRKYEDTKPALNQVYTHATILEIGNKIANQSEERSEQEKQALLQRCEEQAWKKAEEYKNKCVEEALLITKQKSDKKCKKLRNEHENTLQREISRVEGVMHHRCLEKVQEARVEGEKKLNDVVAKLYTNFSIGGAINSERVRQEEKDIADEEKEFLIKKYEQILNEQRNSDEEHALFKMEELRSEMENEKIEAVDEALNKEKSVAEDYLSEVESQYQNIIHNLTQELEEEKAKCKATQDQLDKMTSLKDRYITKMKEAKIAFTTFVEKSRPDFSEGQADYLLSQEMFEIIDESQ